MLNRLTVSALLKAVIAITSICVVIALSLTAYESWDRLKTANRISQIADTSADLFKAMHNLRTDRSTTVRLLNATEPMDGEIENICARCAMPKYPPWRARSSCCRPWTFRNQARWYRSLRASTSC